MNIRELVERHPAIVRDRHRLTFTKRDTPADIAEAFSRHGAMMLRRALPASSLLPSRFAFHHFARTLGGNHRPWDSWFAGTDDGAGPQWSGGEDPTGSWHRPWAVRYWSLRPTATVISGLLKSWAWPVVERLCGSTDIAILLGVCMARHAIDRDLGVGAHQDAQGLPPEIPFSMWLPLHGVEPGRRSGLGFVVGALDRLLPLPPGSNLDMGDQVVIDNLDAVWVPTYKRGDFTIHASYTPHFTTGYGTGSHRYSVEIRAMARDAAPATLQDPAVYVGRQDGVPAVVGSHCSQGVRARDFLEAVRGGSRV
jgi:hypothetical protein